MKKDGIYIAFELLIEEIEKLANSLNEVGAEAFRKGDYDKARQAIETADRIVKFREKVEALKKEWELIPVQGTPPKRIKAPLHRKRKLPKGLITPQEAFRRPILEALVELGGSAPISEVLKLVEQKMKDKFTPYDMEPIPSNPYFVRWKYNAQWCRIILVHEGLMKKNTSRGIWEISEKGRE